MDHVISHRTHSNIEISEETVSLVKRIKNRLKKSQDLILPLDETLDLVDQLASFDLGRFLLHNRGLNGYWTSYIFTCATHPNDHPLKIWLMEKSLLCQARERFLRFKKMLQRELKPDHCIASIPCGVMDDLLDLDGHCQMNIRMFGIDLDPESIEHARIKAKKIGLSDACHFDLRDAWNLGYTNTFDVISSNGLNMYESNRDRLVALYRNFAQALKPGGSLLISFLPPPPPVGDPSWASYGIPQEDLNKEFAIFGNIIQATYLNFVSEEEIRRQMHQSGLDVVDVVYNDRGVLPILKAIKPY